MKTNIRHLLIALALLASLPRAFADTTITYQGQLGPVTIWGQGSYTADLVFTLFNTNSGGSPVGGPITNTAVVVNSNGLFTTTMDFGPSIFNGSINWLEIAVQTNGGGAFTTLTPRQQVTSAPQSIYALNAGTAAIATTAASFSGSVSGDVSGPQGATVVTSVGGQTAANVASGVIAANAATSANTPNTIVSRDGSGSFAASSATLGGSLYLPFPAIIYSGTNTVFVEEGNLFLGGSALLSGINYPTTGNNANPKDHDVGIGDSALSSGDTGGFNTAIGEQALQYNTTGSKNTAGGYQALQHNTTGSNNKADGYQALYSNISGNDNTANGFQALYNNNAKNNTAEGYQALYFNNIGVNNTAEGFQALYNNNTGGGNTANGVWALLNNNIGNYNAANGAFALQDNLKGNFNTANGWFALFSNTTGNNNTANGGYTLWKNMIGINNTADGSWALAYATGMNNIGVGYGAGQNLVTGDNNIYIGNLGTDPESYTIRIGAINNTTLGGGPANTYIAGIWNTPVSGQTVVVDGSGHLGVGAGSGGGVTSVAGSGHITAAPTTGNVVVTDDGTPANMPGDLVSRDANGSFNANNVALGSAVNCPSPLQNGVLNLPATAGISGSGGIGAVTLLAGGITLNGSSTTCGSTFLHGFGRGNFFGGLEAGNFTMTGTYNVGVGYEALASNMSGYENTASGILALFSNISGNLNTANGEGALYFNMSGSDNTAIGGVALYSNMTGNNNIAVGFEAGNLITLDNNIDIGNLGNGSDSGIIRIGTDGTQTKTFIAAINTPITGVPVCVTAQGQLGIGCSSERFKKDIRSMDDASGVVLSLRPVTYQYKPEIDPQGIQRFGLVAEEVDKVDPDLVARDDKQQILTVRYDAVNAMLLNEFLKQHRKVEEQNGEIAIQSAEIRALKEKAAKVDLLENRLNELQALVKQLAEQK